MLLFKYNYLDTNAIRNNLIYQQNGQLYDVPSKSSSPYVESTFFVATPLFPAEAEITQGEHYFSFDPNTIISNSPVEVQSVSIDFDDGYGVQQLYSGDQLQRGIQNRGVFGAIGRFFGKVFFLLGLLWYLQMVQHMNLSVKLSQNLHHNKKL